MDENPQQCSASKGRRRGPYAFSLAKGNLSGEAKREAPKVTKWRMKQLKSSTGSGSALFVEDDASGSTDSFHGFVNDVPDSPNLEHAPDMVELEAGESQADSDRATASHASDMSEHGCDDDVDLEAQPPSQPFQEPPVNWCSLEPEAWEEGSRNDLQEEDTWYEAAGFSEPIEDPSSEWYDAPDDWNNDSDISSQMRDTFADEDSSESEDDLLYDGAPITVAESMLLILTLVLRHSLTGSCLVDILTLVSLHCQKPNLCRTSLHLFRQYFSNLSMPLKVHKFCSKCYFILDDVTDECPSCRSIIANDLKSVSYFIEIPLLTQLENLFKRKDFCEGIKYRFHRKKKNEGNIEDIYDGGIYKTLSSPGQFLCSKNNISFMWYTDGISVFKSSRFSLWPVYFVVNELSPKKRLLKENLLIAGLWYGETKPCMGTFLKPFHLSLKNIYDGVAVHNFYNEEIQVRGVLLCGTCDMPAKCMVLNMTQFNGLYGCPRCTQPGEVINVGRGHARVFPANMNDFDGPKRTHEQTLKAAEEAFQSKRTILGIKGPSWFLYNMPDIIHGTAIDWMHQVLLGIVRRLLHLWFDSSQSSEPYSISNLVDKVDTRLRQIRPPNFISRAPRSIKDHLKYWKASECRSWLFYYSLPVLYGLLADVYFQHYLLLVEAIYLLNGDSVSPEIVNHCELVLKHFCMMHATLYSQREMTSNIHQLLHLCDVVRDLGPLWVYSCFTFESLNGELASLFHGTQKVDLQIASNICTFLKIPHLLSNLKVGSPVSEFYLSMRNKISLPNKGEKICEGTYTVGTLKKYLLNREEKHALRQLLGHGSSVVLNRCFVFARILKNMAVICSKEFTLPVRRNSFTVLFMHDNNEQCGHVTKFVKCSSNCSCETNCSCSDCMYIAFIDMLESSTAKMSTDDVTSATVHHIVPFKRNVITVAVPIEAICNLCVFVDFQDSDTVYVAKCPNTIERD